MTSPPPTHREGAALDALGLGLLALLVVGTAAFALLAVPRDEPAYFVTLLGLSFVLAGLAFGRLRSGLRALRPGALVRFALLTAACLRVGAALAPTSLSDDVYRYVWDGELLADSVNPYDESPAARVNRGEAPPERLDALNSDKFVSIYPPLAQVVFAWGVTWAHAWGMAPDQWLRLLFGLFDLLTVGLLHALLGRLRRPRELVLLYAWNPLVYWELAGGGHTEAIALPFLALALAAALRGRWLGLGLALGVAGLAKTTVLVAAPVLGWYLLRRRPDPPRRPANPEAPWWHRYHARPEPDASLAARACALLGATASTLAVLAVGYAPFWFDGLIQNLRSSLSLYYGYFIFDSPLYELARWLLGYHEGVTPDVADRVLPVFAAVVIATTAVAAVTVNGRSHRLAAGVMAALLAHLLFSPVLHPWYLVPVLFVAVLARAWAPLGLSALVGMTYLAYTPDVGPVTTTLLWLQFAPFALLLGADVGRSLLGPVLRRRARRKYRAAAPWVPPGARLLDLGAGEGFVGAEAARHGHAVTLVDVADHNQTALPHHVYDGRVLPFETGSYDVGILAYVLHHCREPDVVVREAARVCDRLVVLESVYESEADRRLLTTLDHTANWFRGIPVEPLHFDRVEGWRARFAELGLRLRETRWLGRFVHKHVLFVLDCSVASRAPRDAGSETRRENP